MHQTLNEKLSQKTLDKINEIFSKEISAAEKQDAAINGTHIIEAEYYCTDGSIIRAPMSISFLRDESGKTIGILGMCTDVAEKMADLERLRESEISYRRLFEAAKDGILILDAQTGKINDVNPYLIKMLGWSKENMTAKMIWQIGAFRDIVANKKKFLELQSKGYIRYENLPLITTDGKKIEVEFVSNVYLADNKKVIQCNIRDISERIQMQKKVDYERNLAKLYFDTANVMFVVIGCDEIIISVNKRSSEILCADINDIVGKNWFDVFLPSSAKSKDRELFKK